MQPARYGSDENIGTGDRCFQTTSKLDEEKDPRAVSDLNSLQMMTQKLNIVIHMQKVIVKEMMQHLTMV